MSISTKGTEYQKFLEQKHAGLNAPDELVQEVVLDIVGSPLVHKERIVKGEINEVYKGTIERGEEVIVRIGRSEFVKFQREQWALGECARIGLPVPTVLGIRSTKHDGQEFNFSVENLLPGTPLNEIPRILEPENKDRLRNVLKNVGEVLSRMHGIKTSNYGELDGAGKANSNSIREYFKGSPYLSGERMMILAQKAEIDSTIMDKAVAYLNDSLLKFTLGQPHLVHCDFAPKHLLISDDQVSGVIDFENAEGGDPIRDLAYWQFFDPEYPVEVIMEGYEDKSIFDARFKERMKFWRLYVGITTLEYAAEQKNAHSIQETRAQLEKDVEALR
ncbi:MAG TPA: aminoglycoside phosphotransferase family protein [Candidatus Paceibacterota bacterium]